MGWFYDEQLNNKDYTVRLCAMKGNSNEYDLENPIAKAIFSENFEFEVGNSWSNFDGGDRIGDLYNSIKPLAGYADVPFRILRNMRDSGQFDDNRARSRITKAVNKGMMKLTDSESTFKDYLNKSLVVQGTRFIYFSGSSIDMSNLVMKYTIMHDPVNDLTVQEQLKPIIPYIIGDFNTMDQGSGTDKSARELLSLIGWQDPPGGFQASYKTIDTQLKGTLQLVFGKMFYIDNLVVKSGSVSLSRVKVKPRGNDNKPSISHPLYADVTLTFQLGGYITKNSLMKFANIV